MAIVQERRTLDLADRETDIHLRDVAATADFSSVSLRPVVESSFKVVSQTFTEHVNDPDAILRKAVGHEIIINRKQQGPLQPGERVRPPETITAKLLGFDEHQLVIETPNRQLPIQIIPRGADIAEIKLMADSGGATTKPPISCRISTDKPGPHEAMLTYRASGIWWQANYELLLGDEKPSGQFGGSISIINRTGVAFEDARINLAPSVSRASAQAGKPLYALPQLTSIPADAAQRIPLVDAPAVSYQMVLACAANDYRRYPSTASTYLSIENTSKNGLGAALPPGRIRVSRQGTSGAAPIILAEDSFAAAEPNRLMLIRLGQPSQVSARRRESRSHLNDDGISTEQKIQITLRNRSDAAQRVLLIETVPASAEIIEKSDDYQKQSRGVIFPVNVPAGGEKIVAYTLREPAQ